MRSRTSRLATTLLLAGALSGALASVASPATSAEDQFAAAVAFDGLNYLVVWQDYRAGASADIYGARVSQSGAVLDRAGIPISRAGRSQRSPAVAFDGVNYLVVWEDNRSASSRPDVYGARVNPGGVVLDPGGIPISTAPGREFSPALTRRDSGTLVVWAKGSSGSDVQGARVSPAGAVLDPSGLAISTASNEQLKPAVAFDGTNALVVWEDYRSGPSPDVYAARVSGGGAVLDATGIAIATGPNYQWNPAIAYDGTNFTLAWESYASGGGSDIYATRVSTAGAVLAPTIAVATPAGGQTRPAVAFDGANYLIAWQDDRFSLFDIHGARLSPAGSLLDPSPLAISSAPRAQLAAALAFGGSNYFVVWEDGRASPGGSDIVGTRVSPAGAVLDSSGIPIPKARDTRPPRTRIAAGPRGRQTSRKATFRFRSNEGSSTFQCRLDRRPWRTCRSPKTYKGLVRRTHTFRVRAHDRAGNVDRTPAKRRFRVAEPVPGLLHTVPGRTKRSGPGPLRRYTVQIEDGIGLNRRTVAETIDGILADRRSWGGTGRVSFQRVSSGAVSVRIVLATPPTVDRLCAPLPTGGIYSCGMYGRAVLNLMRWRRGAPAFDGNMTRYRRYLVNHEVGHLLGHGHRSCHQAGARAPVMMQQTKGVGTCRPNGWPLDWERG